MALLLRQASVHLILMAFGSCLCNWTPDTTAAAQAVLSLL